MATLLSVSPKYILAYLTDHPIDWKNEDKALTRHGASGDRAGSTPTPAVGEFLSLLLARRTLFTQAEYVAHCRNQWLDWLETKTDSERQGVRAKLYRNFYPSMIDSLHVWAMLTETGRFDSCVMDTVDDAIGKTDLTMTAGEMHWRLALLGPTSQASDARDYKLAHRPGQDDASNIAVQIPIARVRDPGNKRWFRLNDFSELFREEELLRRQRKLPAKVRA